MNQEKFSDSKPVEAIAPTTALAATVTGSAIDTQFYNSLILNLDITISAGSVDSVKFQESSDSGSSDAWEDIPAQENLYYPDDFPVSASAILHCGCVAKERYVRLVVTCTGPTGTIGSQGFLQSSLTKPMVKESSVIADADVISPDATADAVSTPPKRQ
jgi:hypothetical protein